MMGCRVSSFTAGPLYNIHAYFFFSFPTRKKGEKMCPFMGPPLEKVTVTERERVYSYKNVYQNF